MLLLVSLALGCLRLRVVRLAPVTANSTCAYGMAIAAMTAMSVAGLHASSSV